MIKKSNTNRTILAGGALVLAATVTAYAQPGAFMLAGPAQPPLPPAQPKPVASASASPGTNFVAADESSPVEKLLNGKIPGVLADGKVNVNERLRYEQADEEGVKAVTKTSYAPTLRSRIGYTTASLYGFQGMVEGVNITDLGPEHNYNAAGSNGQAARPVVADPPMTRVDQVWAGYTYTNWLAAKVGQQQINLDNQRFIGDVGWRQNMQTFDAASLDLTPLKNFDIYYSYLWYVNRVFGNVAGLPAANTDFKSHSHLINLDYSGWKYGRFVGYTYLLNLKDSANDANSCATYGGYFAGEAALTDLVAVDYRAECAWQTGYGNNPLHYGAGYFNLEGGVSIRPFAFGAGYESLGSAAANGTRTGFQTPLATLHSFNGWDDNFLTTPPNGLDDLYGYAQVTLPWQVPIRFIFHQYNADYGGGNYGPEFDLMASKKFGKYWTALLAYAYSQGEDAAAVPPLTAPNVDVQKFWAQLEFDF